MREHLFPAGFRETRGRPADLLEFGFAERQCEFIFCFNWVEEGTHLRQETISKMLDRLRSVHAFAERKLKT